MGLLRWLEDITDTVNVNKGNCNVTAGGWDY